MTPKSSSTRVCRLSERTALKDDIVLAQQIQLCCSSILSSHVKRKQQRRLTLYGRVRSGFDDAVFFLPSTKTWSQQRSWSDSVRSTFRFRSRPFGLDSCDAAGAASTQRTNRQCEFCYWVAEQMLTCSTARLILVFPKDREGHSHGGPSSIWCLQEFMMLENLHDARRCGAFGCQLVLPHLCSCLLCLVGRAVRLGSLGSEAWLKKYTWP